MKPPTLALAVALALVAASAADADAPQVRIAIVYDTGDAGLRTRQGVHDAVGEASLPFEIRLLDRPYSSEAQGLQVLLSTVEERGDAVRPSAGGRACASRCARTARPSPC